MILNSDSGDSGIPETPGFGGYGDSTFNCLIAVVKRDWFPASAEMTGHENLAATLQGTSNSGEYKCDGIECTVM